MVGGLLVAALLIWILLESVLLVWIRLVLVSGLRLLWEGVWAFGLLIEDRSLSRLLVELRSRSLLLVLHWHLRKCWLISVNAVVDSMASWCEVTRVQAVTRYWVVCRSECRYPRFELLFTLLGFAGLSLSPSLGCVVVAVGARSTVASWLILLLGLLLVLRKCRLHGLILGFRSWGCLSLLFDRHQRFLFFFFFIEDWRLLRRLPPSPLSLKLLSLVRRKGTDVWMIEN